MLKYWAPIVMLDQENIMQVNKLLLFIFGSMAIFSASAHSQSAQNVSECFTPEDARKLDEFWEKYPSAEEFKRYAAPDLKINTNIIYLDNLNKTIKAGPDRAAQMALFLAEHPEHFAAFKTSHKTDFVYFNGEPSAKNGRDSETYPYGKCSGTVGYTYIGPDEYSVGPCVSGNRIQALEFDFIKEKGKVKLNLVEIGMDQNCP